MRLNRFVSFVTAAALVAAPGAVLGASSASAGAPSWQTRIDPSDSAGPNPQLYNKNVGLTAVLEKRDPSTEEISPVAGETVELQAKQGSGFETVAAKETDDVGRADFTRKAKKNTTYRFFYAGGNDGENDLAASQSSSGLFYVAKNLHAKTSRTGRKIYYKVDVAPAGKQTVVLQRKKCAAQQSCKWKKFDSKRTSKGGEAKFLTKNPPLNKTWTYRGMTAQTKSYIQSYGRGLEISTVPARGSQERLVSLR
jgi:hypothetical protein